MIHMGGSEDRGPNLAPQIDSYFYSYLVISLWFTLAQVVLGALKSQGLVLWGSLVS